MRVLLLSILCSMAFVFPPFALAQDHKTNFESLVRAAMKEWKIPGLSIVVVHKEKVVYLAGHGVRTLGKQDQVTADTVFPIASCSKGFTTLAMGMLVDEGKLDWDDRVRKHVPYFRLSDPLADTAVTLRDIVSHRTGVAAHDLLWYGSGWPLEKRIQQACKLEVSAPFRSSFRYQVTFFDAAGAALGSAAKSSWEDFVQKRILTPLEMKSSSCIMPTDKNVELANPHRKDAAGKVTVIPRFPIVQPYPSGSIHSTARDMANYLRFQLGDGVWQGDRLITRESLVEPHTPQITLRLKGGARQLNPETLFLNYGMGWIVQDYRGKRLLMHGGSIDGFRAHVTLVPDLELGIALMNNLDGGLANLAISNGVIDLFLGAAKRDWSAYYHELFEEGEREELAHAKALRARRDKDKAPTAPLKGFVGLYRDAVYGDCRIEIADGQLVWVWERVRALLEHFEGDIFLANSGPLVDAPFIFQVEQGGQVASFRAIDRVFKKVS